jgi:Protein of unknown function (DUF419).
MKTKKEVITYCQTLPNVYEDYPFNDDRWAVVRISNSKKTFACIYEKDGHNWVNPPSVQRHQNGLTKQG